MTQERALIVRAVAGEPEAQNQLASIHRPVVLRTARHILGDDALAEDVTQDVFMRLQSALPGFRGESELGTWLYRVTLNRCRDQLRRRRHVALDAAGAAPPRELRVETDPLHIIDTQRIREAVRSAIDRLPPDQKEAVVLRYLSDLSYAEIARTTSTPQGTVASRVFRALKALGADLEARRLELIP